MKISPTLYHGILFSLTVIAMNAPAQPPDTVRVPVTFYDFHPDPKTGDFENCVNQSNAGSVQDRLDKDAKPVFNKNVNCNSHINEWYRPQGAGNASFDRTLNQWTGLAPYKNRKGEYVGTGFNSGSVMANVVVYDSLPFVYDEWTGLYVYENFNFFLLDNRGFGMEPANRGHNYAFTTEIQYRFVYVPGLIFDFVGDDDLLLFINHQLALDLGGIQSFRRGMLNVDDVADKLGLEYGQAYTFSIFHAERHTTQSNIKIMTNLIMPPAYLFFYTKPDKPNTPDNRALGPVDTISAGDTLKLYSRLFDSGFNQMIDRDSMITWEVYDTSELVLSTDSGAVNSFYSTRAGTTVSIRATYIDPAFPDNPVIRVLVVYVKPGKPHHLSIETSPQPDLFAEDTSDTLIIDSMKTQLEVFGAVRDKFGNFLGMAEEPVWKLADGCTLLHVIPDTAIDGHAIVRRSINDTGRCELQLSMDTLLPDSSFLIVEKMPAVQLDSALTRDEDGSGYLDGVELHFDRILDPKRDFDIVNVHVTFGGKNRVVDSLGSSTGFSDSVIMVYLQQDTAGKMQTAMTAQVTIDTIAFGNDPIVGIDTKDGAGPVIEKAVLHVNDPDKQSDDRMYVIYSEPVMWKDRGSPDEIFNYYRVTTWQNDALADLTDNHIEQSDDGAVIIKANMYIVEPFEDLLQLQEGERFVTDKSGNGVVDDSRRAPVISDEKGIKAFAVANPFRPGETTIPPSISRIFGDGSQRLHYGTVLIVRPNQAIDECRVSIVDMFGNTVLKNTAMVKDPDSHKYYFTWDGRNLNGRIVGKGVYLFIATATLAENGKKVIDKSKIGVR